MNIRIRRNIVIVWVTFNFDQFSFSWRVESFRRTVAYVFPKGEEKGEKKEKTGNETKAGNEIRWRVRRDIYKLNEKAATLPGTSLNP